MAIETEKITLNLGPIDLDREGGPDSDGDEKREGRETFTHVAFSRFEERKFGVIRRRRARRRRR